MRPVRLAVTVGDLYDPQVQPFSGRQILINRLCSSFLLAIIALLSLSACSSDQPGDELSKTLTRSVQDQPGTLDPHRFVTIQAGLVLSDLGEGLVGFSPSGELLPFTAESWDVSDDGLQYTFYIREDANWSNGDPVTADHFLFSFRRLFTPTTASPSADDAYSIKNSERIVLGELPVEELGVEVIDTKTLGITLESPTPYFLQVLTDPSLFPLHRPSFEEHGDDFRDPGKYITNGAYRLIDTGPGNSSFTLERNTHYWDNSNTYFDTVEWLYLVPEAAINAFRVGDIDLTDTIPGAAFPLMKRVLPDNIRVSNSFTTYYYGFNLTKPPFRDNPKLREALSLAVDREALTEKLTARGERPAYSLVPPGVEGHVVHTYPFEGLAKSEREQLARAAYTEAGYSVDNPASFELLYNTSEDHQRIAIAVQSMWKEVLGADVELVNHEFKVMISRIRDMDDTNAFRLSWAGSYLDPQAFLQLFETANPNNLTGYSNLNVDSLLEQSATELDPTRRMSLLQEAERLALADFPLVPLYFFVNKHMIADDIEGYEPNALDVHYSKNLRRTLEQ